MAGAEQNHLSDLKTKANDFHLVKTTNWFLQTVSNFLRTESLEQAFSHQRQCYTSEVWLLHKMSIMRSRRVNPWFASPYTCCSFSLVERGHQCILKGGGRWQKVWDQLHASKCCSCLMRRSVRSRLEQESQACTWRDANTLNQTPTSIIELDDMFDSIEKNIKSSKLIYLRFTLTANDYNQSKEPLSSLSKSSSTTSLSSLSLPPSWPEPLIQREGNEVIEKKQARN